MLIKLTFFGGLQVRVLLVSVLLVSVLLVQSSPVQSSKYSMPGQRPVELTEGKWDDIGMNGPAKLIDW